MANSVDRGCIKRLMGVRIRKFLKKGTGKMGAVGGEDRLKTDQDQ